jgi:septum formation protein
MTSLSNLTQKKIILASASPRRQALLRDLGIDFRVIVKEIHEECPGESRSPEEIACCLAHLKAQEFSEDEIGENGILITADTVVALDDQVINKPEDRADAIRMLRLLSGQMHIVYTGVCIRSMQKQIIFADATRVWFKKLTDQEIADYIDTCKPYDKAGSYGVQEWMGYAGVTRIEGSFFNVMGLPTHRLYEELTRF